MRLVLATGSLYRQQLLRNAGIPFEVAAQPLDEETIREALHAATTTCEDAAVTLAELKAQRAAQRVDDPDTIVLGFDQILEVDGLWLGKPETIDEARRHLLRLRGRVHRLPTAVVAFRNHARIWHHVASPSLSVREFSGSFMENYLAACGTAMLQTVGAYEVEGRGAQLMTHIEGDIFTILGVPLLPLLAFLRDQGVIEA